jgi:hypothetical protein
MNRLCMATARVLSLWEKTTMTRAAIWSSSFGGDTCVFQGVSGNVK